MSADIVEIEPVHHDPVAAALGWERLGDRVAQADRAIGVDEQRAGDGHEVIGRRRASSASATVSAGPVAGAMLGPSAMTSTGDAAVDRMSSGSPGAAQAARRTSQERQAW